MRLNDGLLERISRIDWFSNCGLKVNAESNVPIIYVSSWINAKDMYERPEWEDVSLEVHNELASTIHEKHRNQYSYWNRLAEDARAFIDAEVTPKIEKIENEYNLGQIFIGCVKWDILHALMEDAYKKYNHKKHFYLDLLLIYESGNFPCGWDGDYPNGSLLVY